MPAESTYLVKAKIPQHVPSLLFNVERPIVHAILAARPRMYLIKFTYKATTIQKRQLNMSKGMRQVAAWWLLAFGHLSTMHAVLKCWAIASSNSFGRTRRTLEK